MRPADVMGAQAASGATTAAPSDPGARDDGIWLREPSDGAVDVLVDGQRVWSFNPARDTKQVAALWHVAWPAPLRPYLDGYARVSAQEHVSGRVIFDQDMRFAGGAEPVRIQDPNGHPLSISKTGHLGRSFGERDPAATDILLNATTAAIDLLREQGGVAAFLAFGALLGAVREGRLIGHDVDVDISYLSAWNSPADAIRESFQLERMFHRAGWRTWRFSADDFKVLAEGVETGARWIDVFGAFIAGDVFYLMPNVAAPADRMRLLPLGQVELEGHLVPAPAEPETLLEATYGPGWRIPDPSFKFATPRPTVRRMDGWMRSAIANRGHWYPFYEGARSREVPSGPSAFATWVTARETAGAQLIDLGSGTGRDSLWFAETGYHVRGLDYAPPAIRQARSAAQSSGSTATFEMFNLHDLRQVLALGAQLSHQPEPPILYARLLLTAVGERSRHNLWRIANMALRRGGRLYLEFRTNEDDDATYTFGKHFRSLLDPQIVAEEITASGGHVEYHEEGYAMAQFEDEDPHMCRMVASWQR